MSAANIGARGRWDRFVMGLALLVLALGIAGALILAGMDRWWRIALFLPFWAAALGFFQAREKT
jgi:hypothetical protein